MTDLAAGHAQAFEGLRARHFVNEVTVDVEQAGAVFLAVDDVVVERSCRRGYAVRSWLWIRRYETWEG
jgi:hypothetical protein